MRALVSTLLLTSALWSGASVAAAAAADGTKVGVIRAADVVRNSPQYKTSEQKMRTEFEKRQNELEEQGKKLQADLDAYQKEKDLISADERAKREKDLTGRNIDVQNAQRKFRDDFQSRDRELTQNLMEQIKTVIEQVAKEKGLEVIVQDPVYAVPSLDITDEVLKRMSTAAPAAKK